MGNTRFEIKLLERASERFEETLDQMDLTEANTMPKPLIKSVTWLIWHTAREIDYQISELNGSEPLWVSAGWNKKFSLDLPDDTQDWQHTPEEAKKVVVKEKQLLIDYLNDSIHLANDYLENVDEASFSEVIDTNWTPPVTRGDRIISIIDDAFRSSSVYQKIGDWQIVEVSLNKGRSTNKESAYFYASPYLVFPDIISRRKIVDFTILRLCFHSLSD